MSIPVVEIEHKTENIENGWCPQLPPSKCRECLEVNKRCIGVSPACLPNCPACAVEKNNKAWVKHLTEVGYWGQVWHEVINENRTMWCIPEADWEQIKKLAENKED